MKRKINRFILYCLLGSSGLTMNAQQWIWDLGYHGFFDNREYFNDYVKPQTMFGSRIFGYTGISFDNRNEFGAGISGLYEFGDRVRKNSFHPILFYHFNNSAVNLFLGAYPRYHLIELPDFLLSDTLDYYRPNFEGIYLELKRDWGSQRVWLDWTSRQDDSTRETFKIGGTGMIRKGAFFYRHDFVMTHFAGPAIPIPDDHIRDNGGLYCGLGLNLDHQSLLDTLVISSGLCFSYDRRRNVYDVRFYYGNLTQITVEYKGFGIKTSTYFGQGQNQIDGDGLYAAPLYNRFDFYWRIFRKDAIQGKVEFSLHLIQNILDTSQSFTIYANLGGGRTLEEHRITI
jgi:hypothetical protein